MDNAAGKDLTWFWNEWFFTTWKLDQAMKDISYVDNDPAKGALITIENLGEMAMPVTIFVKEENGNSSTVKLPAEIWQRGGRGLRRARYAALLHETVVGPACRHHSRQHKCEESGTSPNSVHTLMSTTRRITKCATTRQATGISSGMASTVQT